MDAQKSGLLGIKEFAKACRTTPRTLRFYEQKGLFKPFFIDQFTKYRYYKSTQTRDFFKIKLLHNFEIPLNKIHEVLRKNKDNGALENQIQALREHIIEKEKEYDFLKQIRYFLFKQDDIKTQFKKEVFGPYILLCKIVSDGRYDRINADILESMQDAKKIRIPITDKPMVFYLDPVSYKPVNTGLEVCLITMLKKIPKDIVLPKGYYLKEYPRTQVRVFNYKGPFDYITLIYQKIFGKVVRELRPNEVGFDMHIYGPWNRKSPYDHLTKIAFPVK